MSTPALIAHHIPGRARLLVPGKRGDVQYFARLSAAFSQAGNVKCVKSNPETGSLTVEFRDDLGAIMRRAQAQDLFTLDQSPTVSLKLIQLVSGRKIDAMFMLGSVMGAAGMVQLMRGRVLVPAISFFWYAMQAFRRSGS